MNLWLDDKREPDPRWVWAKTSHCAIVMLTGGNVDKISFAPDQLELVAPVVDWMLANNVHPSRAIHPRSGGVKSSRGLLVCRAVAAL